MLADGQDHRLFRLHSNFPAMPYYLNGKERKMIAASAPAERFSVRTNWLSRRPSHSKAKMDSKSTERFLFPQSHPVWARSNPRSRRTARQMMPGFHYSYYYHNAYAENQYLASQGYVVVWVNYRLGIMYWTGLS